MIKVENLCKRRGEFKLENISFELKEGYIMGLIGPNGSGKTTLIKLILGLLKADEGEIKIFDKDIFEDEIYVKDNIGFVFDNFNFYQHLNIKDYKRILKNSYSKFDEKLFNSYIESFGIKNKSYIGNLSKGETIKVMVAGALSHDAKLIVLDEPTAGLDPKGRDEILGQIKELHNTYKMTIILVSHSMEDVAKLAERVVVMNKGEIYLDGRPGEVFMRIEELEEVGLAVPQVTYLIRALKEKGFPVSDNIITVEEAKEELLRLYREGVFNND